MKNHLKTALLLGALTGILLLIGSAIGGRVGATFFLFISIAMNMGAYWFSDKLALKMSGAKPVTAAEAPDLYRMVTKLTASADLPMPRLYVIPSEQPNAFATGRNPQHSAVAVTEGIMKALTQDELEGVIAHELAHIKNRDILIASVAATIAGVISYLGMMARWGMMFGGGGNDEEGGGLGALAAAIVAPIGAMFIQLAISRSREFEADRVGAVISGRPEGLASALRKIESAAKEKPMEVNPAAASLFIVNPLSGMGRSMIKMFSTHPPTEERIRRLESMMAKVS